MVEIVFGQFDVYLLNFGQISGGLNHLKKYGCASGRSVSVQSISARLVQDIRVQEYTQMVEIVLDNSIVTCSRNTVEFCGY